LTILELINEKAKFLFNDLL